ncbi:hypothetical protein RRG08_059328 [Elysia crispata]|uniref:Uncharacterized protein n=1 Tax=Elysia crispata TaxID=231223 RepID=A0AAE1EGP2_9GAST|nr:hypothetical protein RRG08_059328 [Elysia crispata]
MDANLAVSRKAKQKLEGSIQCPLYPCRPGSDAVGEVCYDKPQLERKAEVEVVEVKELVDFYAHEREDPDYMAVRDDGCGDYIVSRVDAS